ncbi:MAG: hypothetical protein LBC63_05335, partial [Holophagales bacterium]|nr:hypothetical protein [Holophagales bacterium]
MALLRDGRRKRNTPIYTDELLAKLGVTSAPDLPLSLAGFCNLHVYSAFTPEPAPVGRSLHLR